jgi:hypothetical protein
MPITIDRATTPKQPTNGALPGHITVEVITPQLAKDYLAKNIDNRTISLRKVREYATFMKEGRWLFNGDTISFGESGRLINGQHRLLACIESGASFQVIVVREVPTEDCAFGTIDRNYTRTAGQILGAQGYKDANRLAAVATFAILVKRGEISKNGVAPDELASFILANPSIERSSAMGRQIKHLMIPSVAGGLHFIFADTNKQAADALIERVALGADLPAYSPEFVLRKYLERNQQSKAKVSKIMQAAVLVKTWNAIRTGKPMRVCKWAEYEEFPEISR